MLFQRNKAKTFHHRNLRLHSTVPYLSRQQGIVIVVALFFVALVAAIAYYMTARLDRDTRRTSLLINNAQAEYYARGSIAWAILSLRDNFKNQQTNKLVDVIPISSAINVVNGYKIHSVIYDMQARYNLNNLRYPAAQADFKRLLQALIKELPEEKATEIAVAISDWVAVPQGNMADYYAKLASPYTSPHRSIASITELRLIKGITPQIYNMLQPFLIALPIVTPINVQTASAPVFVTLDTSITLDNAKAIEQIRKQTPFVSPQIFQNLDIIKGANITSDKFTVISNYFLVETTVSKEDQTLVVYTLLERISFQNKIYVTILWESKGIW